MASKLAASVRKMLSRWGAPVTGTWPRTSLNKVGATFEQTTYLYIDRKMTMTGEVQLLAYFPATEKNLEGAKLIIEGRTYTVTKVVQFGMPAVFQTAVLV